MVVKVDITDEEKVDMTQWEFPTADFRDIAEQAEAKLSEGHPLRAFLSELRAIVEELTGKTWRRQESQHPPQRKKPRHETGAKSFAKE